MKLRKIYLAMDYLEMSKLDI